jgi:hypothetical protein
MPLPPTVIDRLIHLITNSGPIGFALLFVASIVFGLRYFKPEAVAFSDPSQLAYIFYAGLFGGGLVFLKVWVWLNKKLKLFWEYLKQRHRYVTAANRTDELLPDEMKAVCWMLLNNDKKIIGRQFDDPFAGLIGKGFLVRTDPKQQFQQVFYLHPYVASKSEHILATLPDGLQKHLTGIEPPWEPKGRIRL